MAIEGIAWNGARTVSIRAAGIAMRLLGGWAQRKWWPTKRILEFVRVTADVGDGRRPVVISKAQKELQVSFRVENNTPYNLEFLGATVTVILDHAVISKYEIGHCGEIPTRTFGVLADKRRLTSDEIGNVTSSEASRIPATGPLVVLSVDLKLRINYGYHLDSEWRDLQNVPAIVG